MLALFSNCWCIKHEVTKLEVFQTNKQPKINLKNYEIFMQGKAPGCKISPTLNKLLKSKARLTLGVRDDVQPKSSIPIGPKSWTWPQGLYSRSQGWNIKIYIFNLPQATNKCWTLWPCIGPKAEKGHHGSQFATLGANLPAFINSVTSMF